MSKKKSVFSYWWAFLAGAIICYALAVVLWVMMYYAIYSLSLDVDNIFGAIFGMIGAVGGIAAIYSQYASIFLWIGIACTVPAIVFYLFNKRGGHPGKKRRRKNK